MDGIDLETQKAFKNAVLSKMDENKVRGITSNEELDRIFDTDAEREGLNYYIHPVSSTPCKKGGYLIW